jgi:FPC/CPF motif-containing protein YcgG
MGHNPFDTEMAVRMSNLHFVANRELLRAVAGIADDPFVRETHRKFRELVMAPEFPCLGAKAAFNERDLFEFREHKHQIANGGENRYTTFVAVFRGPLELDEAAFEELLWRQLRQLHRADAHYFEWDPAVSADPNDPHFSFSFAGQAFYVVGMHPNSSRMARRFPWPALIFNPHEQFERLRADGKWKRMQQSIRARDVTLQGSVNPMLSDFGEESEARQYSGRAVPADWVAPFPNAERCPFSH